MACIVCSNKNYEYHHVYTKKAWPRYKDCLWNLIPLCRNHHRLCHDKGLNHLVELYPTVKKWLKDNDFEFDDFSNKFLHIDKDE